MEAIITHIYIFTMLCTVSFYLGDKLIMGVEWLLSDSFTEEIMWSEISSGNSSGIHSLLDYFVNALLRRHKVIILTF